MYELDGVSRRRHRKGARHHTDRSLRIARSGALAALVAAPLALGGAHPSTNAALAAALVLAWSLSLPRLHKQGRLQLPGWLGIVLLAALGCTLLQCLPLPVALLRYTAPGAYAVLAPQLPAGAWHMPGLDLPLLCHELLKLAAYVAAAWLGAHLFRDRYRGQQVLVALAMAGTAVVSVGLVQLLLDIHRPYNLYGNAGPQFAASFINPNHLAGFLGFCCLTALAAMPAEVTFLRWVMLASSVLCGAGVFMSLSRAGILSLVAALLFVAITQPLRRRGMPLRWVQAALCGVLLVSSLLAHTQIVHEMWTLSGREAFPKTRLWTVAPELLRAFPLGMGRGTFSAVFPRYRPESFPNLTFTHLENEWLQTLVDFGPLMAAALIAGMGMVFWRLLQRDAQRPGSVAGAFVFLLIDNLADFNLQISGVALPAVLVLASLASAERPDRAAPAPLWPSAAALAACMLIVGVAAPVALRHTLQRDTAALSAALHDDSAPLAQRLARAESFAAWHPADSLLPLLVAQHLLETEHDSPGTLAWVNRSLLRDPRNDGALYVAGHALLAQGRLEEGESMLRQACVINPHNALAAAHLQWQATGDAAAAARLADADRPQVRLTVAGFLLDHQAPAAALEALGPDLFEHDMQAVLLAARAHLALGHPDAAVGVAAQGVQLWPRQPQPYVLQAQAQLLAHRPEAALAALDTGLQRSTHPEGIIPHAVNILADRGEFERAQKLAKLLLERTGTATAETYMLLGLIEERQHHLLQALHQYERARDQNPANLAIHLAVVRLYEQLGDTRGAISSLENARRLVNNPALDHKLAALRTQAAQLREQVQHEAYLEGRFEPAAEADGILAR